MAEAVKRRYDNSRRQAQVRSTRRKVIEAAKRLFTQHGYPATTIEAIAEAADTPLPTVYRLFGSKRALLAAVLDTAFGGDDQPIAFADRPAVRAAQAEPDPVKMVNAFARLARELMERSSAIQHVLATAAQVDPDAAGLLAEIRRQRHTGQSRIVAALAATGALDPSLDTAEAADLVYALLSPDVHRILTVERGWPADRYERWIARSLATLLPPGQCPPANPASKPPEQGNPASSTSAAAKLGRPQTGRTPLRGDRASTPTRAAPRSGSSRLRGQARQQFPGLLGLGDGVGGVQYQQQVGDAHRGIRGGGREQLIGCCWHPDLDRPADLAGIAADVGAVPIQHPGQLGHLLR
jgi:AcrR family transcriptional regulator